LEKSGAAEAAEGTSATGGFGTVKMLFIANHDIVRARNVAGKLSFTRIGLYRMILALREKR